MSVPVAVSRLAEAEILAAEAWYEGQSPGLGARFRQEVEQALDNISQMPGRFPPNYKNTRVALVATFPYLIIFRETRSRVTILSVVHASRGSSPWLNPP